MTLGVDVHKHTHTAALLGSGGEIATMTFSNSSDGIARLLYWLAERGGAQAVALIAAGHEVLTVPSWNTHRNRDLVGRGRAVPGVRPRSPRSCCAGPRSWVRRLSPRW